MTLTFSMVSSSSPPPLAHAISGSLGSALALMLLYPLERVRTEMQASAMSSSPTRIIVDGPSQKEEVARSADECRMELDEKDSPQSASISPASSNESWVPIGSQSEQQSENKISKSKALTSIDETESLIACLRRLQSKGELYRGVSPVISTLAISNFVFFYANQIMKALFAVDKQTQTKKQVSRSLLASSLAGIINVLITNPLWVANLRIVQGRPISKSESKNATLWREVQAIKRVEGISSLWKGTITSLLLVSNPVIQFFFYGQVKQHLLKRKRKLQVNKQNVSISPLEAFLVGAIAKAIATVFTYPLQLAQVLLRLDSNNEKGDRSPYLNTFDCLIRLMREQGLFGIFKGMKAKLLQATLTAAFTFLSYEQILQLVHGAFLIVSAEQRQFS
mmetsp:Transcript_26711/g.40381  ORF Transcript_26711/g.40381 Transcript_26711/m.40381 type:complete len:393 (-) Transcript_26711:131-1309(-)